MYFLGMGEICDRQTLCILKVELNRRPDKLEWHFALHGSKLTGMYFALSRIFMHVHSLRLCKIYSVLISLRHRLTM